MRTIWKYEVYPDLFNVEMPIGAKILSCQVQNRTIQMWALVDTGNKLETRQFVVFGTGQEINDYNLQFIATFQPDPYLVFHLFEIK